MNKEDMVCFERFEEKLGEWNISLTGKQKEQFLLYFDLLEKGNSIMNLTTIIAFEDVLDKHFLDSLSVASVMDLSKVKTLMDIGTGAGFPGIPIKILYPQIKVTLLDSSKKKVLFLNETVQALDLEDIIAIHGRAEDYAKDPIYRDSYELVTSRAVALLASLSELCLPFVKKGGYFVSYKSEKAVEEMANAKNAIFLLNGKVERQEDFYLPGTDIFRKLIVILKVGGTPKKYPRKAGLPVKNPL